MQNALFSSLLDIAVMVHAGQHVSAVVAKQLHDALVQTCYEGLRGSGQAYGNLFSQVDFLCNKYKISMSDRVDIQTMRRHGNHMGELSGEELLYDIRALGILMSAVTGEAIPDEILGLMPHTNRPIERTARIDVRCIRCIVQSWDTLFIYARAERGLDTGTLVIDYSGDDLKYIGNWLKVGMQLNLLDCKKVSVSPSKGVETEAVIPSIIIIEPDFLLDISSVAACFKDYGHHPLEYTVGRMKPRVNTYSTLLGNFAGSALDDIINAGDDYNIADTLRSNFRDKSLEYCTCADFNGMKFKQDAQRQTNNIRQAVSILFGHDNDEGKKNGRYDMTYSRAKAILEPSFVCERLGLQGRIDLMTTDFSLLVEQKSGRNMNIERKTPNRYGSFHLEPHYVQLLLYYGVLRYNFNLGRSVDMRLLYSKYPATDGLVVVSAYRRLFNEAIRLRNMIVAYEIGMARDGFKSVIDLITPETLNEKKSSDSFYMRYLYPEIAQVAARLRGMTPLERAYYCRMMTFVYREQLISKVGAREGVHGCMADLWNMPLAGKIEAGNIYTGLVVKNEETDSNGCDIVTMTVPGQGEDFLPNFRRGDMVYLYAYKEGTVPDVRSAILYRGNLKEIRTDELVVALMNVRRLGHEKGVRYAIEHSGSDAHAGAAIRGLHRFVTADEERRDLLLGQREPRRDKSLRLTTAYNPSYDEILLKSKQARDYFLLVGPPGTGKTSMALKFMVLEELADDNAAILLMSYTNRAVDEICGMLEDAGLDYMRIGGEYSCDPRFRNRLLEFVMRETPRLDAIKKKIEGARIIVGTTSMMQARPFVFAIKHFTLAVIDEAGQILEPDIIGLLSENIGRFILIGDHKQLPAVVQQCAEDSAVTEPCLTDIGLTDCRNSLFERLLRAEYSAGRTCFTGVLRKQGRMHPEVAEFPNRMFYARERLEPVPLPHQKQEQIGYDISGGDSVDYVLKNHRVIFIPSEKCIRPDLSDKVNINEARIVCDIICRIRRFYGERFDAAKTVGVIVPYRNQIAVIRKELERTGDGSLMDVSIDTVERYQGSQRDVIIYSCTVQRLFQLEFLTANSFVEGNSIIDRKLNVAITRARKQMIMTGNEQILSADTLYRDFIRQAYVLNECNMRKLSE